ncbi:GNAT family N-acetyltransferase [Vibrio sp. WXL103]|uniref:GNAT family N-acetyltransferase n=1 Tax=unclassified Vibrio TaxID=2614977 RepID=UPI003EC8D93E
MDNKPLIIRSMDKTEFSLAIDWAAQEGWNPGLCDNHSYYAADPDGFLVGLVDGKPVATISVVKYNATFGFIGFYIVEPEYRGRGYGLQIWQAGLAKLKGCNIGLDGVIDQQDNYTKSGFKLAYRNIRFEGRGGVQPVTSHSVVDLDSTAFSMIEQYNQPLFPAPRAAFDRAWIEQSNARTLGIIEEGRLRGYGVIRQCRDGYKIGPLYADTPGFADSIYQALIATVGDVPVFLDVPEVNQDAFMLAQRYQMKAAFETARMYSGGFPDIRLDKVYGVASFEIG